MSPQLFYALRKVGIAIVLSILGVLAAHQTEVVTAAGQDPLVVGAIITAVLSAAVRVVEGYRDGQRAAGPVANMQKSDVGFEQVLAKAEVGGTAHVNAVVTDRNAAKVNVTVTRDYPSSVLSDPGLYGTTETDPLPYSQD